ncbi:hypothetical protein EDEG_01765 [Edhazardia aedis USNM 41457]|uniref:Uncharacterized protein n=1 Tax=Edhazardia aedis (strain USNM 41457) TaxID=1003232 RepID=J9D8V8_EDHAE|nr:hypothetical protein EDEG_01765 [Edhazardia aedis USNM 41457]|eukprot:EJW03939.1 hypothetical protein EDEG_01765 [Edhazardia aedis USNM 41457]
MFLTQNKNLNATMILCIIVSILCDDRPFYGQKLDIIQEESENIGSSSKKTTLKDNRCLSDLLKEALNAFREQKAERIQNVLDKNVDYTTDGKIKDFDCRENVEGSKFLEEPDYKREQLDVNQDFNFSNDGENASNTAAHQLNRLNPRPIQYSFEINMKCNCSDCQHNFVNCRKIADNNGLIKDGLETDGEACLAFVRYIADLQAQGLQILDTSIKRKFDERSDSDALETNTAEYITKNANSDTKICEYCETEARTCIGSTEQDDNADEIILDSSFSTNSWESNVSCYDSVSSSDENKNIYDTNKIDINVKNLEKTDDGDEKENKCGEENIYEDINGNECEKENIYEYINDTRDEDSIEVINAQENFHDSKNIDVDEFESKNKIENKLTEKETQSLLTNCQNTQLDAKNSDEVKQPNVYQKKITKNIWKDLDTPVKEIISIICDYVNYLVAKLCNKNLEKQNNDRNSKHNETLQDSNSSFSVRAGGQDHNKYSMLKSNPQNSSLTKPSNEEKTGFKLPLRPHRKRDYIK